MTHKLRLEILGAPGEIETIRSEWDALITESRGDIYFTSDWLVAWWQVYGQSRDFVGVIAWDEISGRLIAALPFAIDHFGSHFEVVRTARLAGIDSNYAIMGLPVLTDYAPEVWRRTLEHLFDIVGCAFVSISPISDENDLQAPLLASIQGTKMSIVRNVANRNHTLFDISKSGGLYAELSKGRQREYRRSRNQIERSYQIERIQSSPDTISEDLAGFINLHAIQWQAQGKGGHFSDWPGSAKFLRIVLPRLSLRGQGFVEKLVGDGAVLASRLTFQLGDRVYWRLTARTLDPNAQSMGVGRVALVDWAEDAARRGGRIIEAGAGDYDHKLAYGGRSAPLRYVVIATQRTRRVTAIALTMFDLLHLLYYRIWFLRLAPRMRRWLGMRPRPLWRLWIKSRV